MIFIDKSSVFEILVFLRSNQVLMPYVEIWKSDCENNSLEDKKNSLNLFCQHLLLLLEK